MPGCYSPYLEYLSDQIKIPTFQELNLRAASQQTTNTKINVLINCVRRGYVLWGRARGGGGLGCSIK